MLLIYFFAIPLLNGKKVSIFLNMCRVADFNDRNSFESRNCISVYFHIRFKLKQWISYEWRRKLETSKRNVLFSAEDERNFFKCVCEAFENAQIFFQYSFC